MKMYRVTSAKLNVRFSPVALNDDNLLQPPLILNDVVECIEASANEQWLRVRIHQDGKTREGWVAARHLAPVEPQAQLSAPMTEIFQAQANGRLYEMSLAERYERLTALEALLNNRAQLSALEIAILTREVGEARRDYNEAALRARYVTPMPLFHPSNAGANHNWRSAWGWTTADFRGRYILDDHAPFNDAQVRNKPGEVQGSNIERVIVFLDAERNPRYLRQGDDTFCTVYVYDATWLLSAEIPITTNRTANAMCDWLVSHEAKVRGWQQVASVKEAQALADKGFPVVATQRHPRVGHVGLVRPVPMGECPLIQNAYIAQAGALNTSQTTVAEVFGDPDRVTFYMHL